jgi:hypothetical protein
LLKSAKSANVPNVLRAQIEMNVEHVAVVAIAIVGDATTIEMTVAEITASHIAVAEQSLLMENF